LTGKDAPVIEYLERSGDVHEFLSHAESLVDMSVDSYQRRGFRHLMVSFGCTGGQHRSVYLAERMAGHLRDKNGLNIVVRHRELESLGK
jgi:RNase adaptor protein for sRNA GlmZ degradation